jgi:hypothetical protein
MHSSAYDRARRNVAVLWLNLKNSQEQRRARRGVKRSRVLVEVVGHWLRIALIPKVEGSNPSPAIRAGE